MTKKIIDKYFEIFHIDSRSSQRELELAYEVLTKNRDLSDEKLREYRLAFEYLMLNHFSIKDDLNFDKEINKDDYLTEEEQYQSVLGVIPEKVEKSLNYCETVLGSLKDKAKVIFATQKVNLPLFFKNITTNCHNFLGFHFWTEKDITKIINESCLNPLQYQTILFEMTNNEAIFESRSSEYNKFFSNIKRYFCYDKKTCPVFKYDLTEYGVTGMVTLEESLTEQFINLLTTKSKQMNVYLNLTT